MQYISFADAYSADYSIERIFAFPQHWSDGAAFCTGKSGRPTNGLMYISDCENTMSSDGEAVTAQPGQIVYIPHSSQYRASFSKTPNTSAPGKCITDYLINFTAKTPAGEPLALSRKIIVFTPEDSTFFKDKFEHIAKISQNASSPPSLLKAAVYEIVTEFSRQLRGKSYRKKNDSSLAAAIEYISENCFTGDISVSQLCEICHVSEATLRRMFYISMNMSPKSYINSLKLNRAKNLLKTYSHTVSEVARLVGFDDAAYFARFFKKHTGMNPSEY